MHRPTPRVESAVLLTGLLCLWSLTAFAGARIDITKEPLGGPFGSGDDVTFQITVVNTGDVPFDAVEVTDLSSPDCYRFLTEFNGAPSFGVGDSFMYTCTSYNVQTDVQVRATARGYTFDTGGCLMPSDRTNSETITVDVRNPGVTIDKHAADGSDLQTVLIGGDAFFEIVVTNTGDVDLTNVAVTDPRSPDCDQLIGPLSAGASFAYSCVSSGVMSSFRNIATVSGNSPDACPAVVKDSDGSEVEVSSPQCSLIVNKAADPLVIVPGPTPDCETLGKPSSLVFKYTGNDCSASSNDQGSKTECAGAPGAGAVDVEVVKDPGKVSASPSSLVPGDLLTLSALGNDMGSEVQLNVGAQSLAIHTSCSAPLAVGDVFGSLELLSFDGETSTQNDVTYTYQVANLGSPIANVSVVDDKLGNIAQGIDLAENEVQTFSVTVPIFESTTNTVTVTGMLAGTSEVCTASDSATVTVDVPAGPVECTTKIQAALLRYTGPTIFGATVVIDPRNSPNVTYSNVDLVSGVTVLSMPTEGNFTVDAKPDADELGSKTTILINGVEEVIHTSCSTPFIAGRPAPLDNPKGDPSPNWFVESFRQK